MKTLTKNAGLFAAVLIGLFVSSCKKDNNDTTPTDLRAHVQLINASPDAGPANLYITDTLKSAANVTYGQTGGYFFNLNSVARQNISIKTPANDTLRTTTSGFGDQTFYSIYLTGQKLGNSLGILVSTDDQTLPAAGNARIKFVNAAPNSGLLDVTYGSTTLYTGQQYGTTAKSKELPAGSYVFGLNVYGSSSSVALPSVTLVSGKIYTIYSRAAIKNGLPALDGGVIVNN